MFEQIVLRRAENDVPISAGQLAEAMLYYQRVHIVIDRGTLSSLISQLGVDALLSVLNRGDVSAVYCEEVLGTHTESVGASQYHNYIAFRLAAGADGQRLKNTEDRLLFDLLRDGVDKANAKRFATAFLRRVPVRAYSDNRFASGGIPKAATEDLRDYEFLTKAVKQVLSRIEGGTEPVESLRFEVLESELGFFAFTNIDFAAINQRRARLSPPAEGLTVAHLLSRILDARADIALASYYGGDFVTSSVTSSIIQVRHAELLRRSGLNLNSRRQFEEIVLSDMPSLSDVVDSGERSFTEFLHLIDHGIRFKDWLKSVSPDENLVKAYLRDISSEGWLQKLPGKSLRYVLTSAMGTMDPVVGLVAGFADTFLVEKVCGGWKPNHFVASRLSRFIGGR